MNARQRRTALRKLPLLVAGEDFKPYPRLTVTFNGVNIVVLEGRSYVDVRCKPFPEKFTLAMSTPTGEDSAISKWFEECEALWQAQFDREHELIMTPPTHYDGLLLRKDECS